MAKIMIVDDSSIVRKTLKKQIEDLGHEVIAEAENGKDAIKKYMRLKPDLVTMDITMPVTNGILALQEIRFQDENAKVIMITSHGEESLVMDAVSHGASGYVLKPITKEKLETQLKKTLG